METAQHTNGGPGLRIDAESLVQLRAVMRGPLVGPEHAEYERLRRVYNGMIDRHPALIARCVDVADVQAAIGFARTHGLPLAVRGGGHNGGGFGTCDNGLVIDLALMRGVRVDPRARTARVAGGSVWGDVDHATHPFGLAVPSGFISTTGVGGLTLGGGLGYLTRQFGYTIDSLLEADLVLADGGLVTASDGENPDLFWALRGGGGNFGVVTSLLFRARPVRDVVGGPTLWPMDRAGEILRWFRGFVTDAPEELSGFFAFLTVPPGPPFPEHLHNQKMCGVVWCHTGEEGAARELLDPVRALRPAFDGVATLPFPALQSAFDPLYPPGLQWHWRADFFNELADAAIDRLVDRASRLPTPLSTIHLYLVDGAANRVGRGDTAFSFREARFAEVIVGVDPDPANAHAIGSWARDSWDALHPFSSGGAYVNFMMDEGHERVRATYRENYDRLAEVKARHDPDNLFRVNQNIPPAGLRP
jgi:FAD/FMN-containing dehydrogenase